MEKDIGSGEGMHSLSVPLTYSSLQLRRKICILQNKYCGIKRSSVRRPEGKLGIHIVLVCGCVLIFTSLSVFDFCNAIIVKVFCNCTAWKQIPWSRLTMLGGLSGAAAGVSMKTITSMLDWSTVQFCCMTFEIQALTSRS